jgi:hypothetical protein
VAINIESLKGSRKVNKKGEEIHPIKIKVIPNLRNVRNSGK